jgi:UDP-N-acetylglucosamine 2-epimerase (non-hydrolysing)
LNRLKVLTVFGTRPEAVKLAPVIRELKKHPTIDSIVCVTAQHREMLDQVLNLFNIEPDYDLNLMQPDQSLAEITAAILTNLDPLLERIKPDWMILQGDTTTVSTSALLAFYRQIKVGHVEAGLRTGNKWQPFPEEINRRIASVIADLHFAPTKLNQRNLIIEGIPSEIISVTGNPVIDALKIISAEPEPSEVKRLLDELGVVDGGKRLILITAHRRENFGQPLAAICDAIAELAETYQDQVAFIYPVHLNPNVQKPVYKRLAGISNVRLIPPLDYLPLVHLMKHATLVMTDSGGIQEEAPGLGIPTLVLREVTERPEGVEAGTLKLVGTDTARIVAECRRLLDDPAAHQAMAKAVNPFGDGHAAERIVARLLQQSRIQ